jgi:N-acetylglucosamine-6-phosphate deacetylase
MTIAPELPGATEAIRWCQRHGIVASLGHSDADAAAAERAVAAGASAVTHVFNGMRPLHHRQPSLLDVALIDSRLTTMVILDGVHVSPTAFRLLLRCKGVERIALVTDSIRHQGWKVSARRGAFYTKAGTLAGSDLTMLRAVKHAVAFGGITLEQAVRMATEVPARLLGDRSRGILAVGKRADVVAFDRQFRARLTMVGGRVVYEG